MEIKKFAEYTEGEVKELLLHWWDYYGKDLYTLSELDEFKEMIDGDSKTVFQLAVLSYINGYGSKGILGAIRNNTVEELKGTVPNFSQCGDEFRKYFKKAEECFIAEIVDSYNKPKDAIPMDDTTIMEQIEDIFADEEEETVLTVSNVRKIFYDSLFKNEEIKDNKPIFPFTPALGIVSMMFFNTERLNGHKSEIKQMLDKLPKLEEGCSFLELCYDQNGRFWSGDHAIIEQLVTLGIGTELLYYPLGREIWAVLPGGVPYVAMNKEKENTEVVGYEPSYFTEYVEKAKIKRK